MQRLARYLRTIPWVAFFLAFLLLVFGSWAADGLKGELLLVEWWDGAAEHRGLVLAGVVAAFIVSAVMMYRLRLNLYVVRTLDQRPARPQNALIIFLSTPVPPPTLGPAPTLGAGRPITVGDFQLAGGDLRQAAESLDRIRWNWQQLLRALIPHEGTVSRIHLIGSAGDEGSFGYLSAARHLIETYLPGVTVREEEGAVDLDDVGSMIRGISQAVVAIEKDGISLANITIDVTGATKTASIAGAIVTLNTEVKFQYVQTNRPFRVLEYDLRVEPGVLIP
jgi:hypothetical protein